MGHATVAATRHRGPRAGLTWVKPRARVSEASPPRHCAGRRAEPRRRRRTSARRSTSFAPTGSMRRGLSSGQGHASRGGRKPHRRRGSAAATHGMHDAGELGNAGRGKDVQGVRLVTLGACGVTARPETKQNGGERRRRAAAAVGEDDPDLLNHHNTRRFLLQGGRGGHGAAFGSGHFSGEGL